MDDTVWFGNLLLPRWVALLLLLCGAGLGLAIVMAIILGVFGSVVYLGKKGFSALRASFKGGA